jgi:hypothetical protein
MRVQLFRGGGRQPWYVRLVSQNGQVLSVSEGYATKWNAKRAACFPACRWWRWPVDPTGSLEACR